MHFIIYLQTFLMQLLFNDFQAEQTETVSTEMIMNEQTQHIPQGSIPSIADVKEKSTEIEEMFEQENAPNSTDTLYTDAEDEKENVAKPSTDEQDGTIDETINEEVSPNFSIKRSMRNLGMILFC